MRRLLAPTLLVAALCVSAFFAASGTRLFPRQHPALAPGKGAIPPTFFGMTINHLPATPWPSIPIASIRTWDTAVAWPEIQKAPGTFAWSSLDAMIDLAQSHGIDLLFTLGRTPRWASASPDAKSPYGPGQCAPPANLQYWDDFVRATVTHAAGKIRFWETWNEPQDEPQSPGLEFYCGDISTMVALQRRTYEIVKALDPDAKVLTPSAVGGYGPRWMSRFLAAGGGKYADIMAFHGYLAPGANPESIVGTIADFRAIFADHGQQAKPVWDTEAGWGQDAWLADPKLQAAFLAKFYILHWSSDVERFYWYAYDNEKWGTLWDAANGLHKAGAAYREVYRWLLGATMERACAVKQNVWRCGLARENGYHAIIFWTSDGSSNRTPISDHFRQYRDLDGNLMLGGDTVVISGSPILVETGSAF